MVSKAQKVRQPEGIKLLPEIAFFRNVPTDLPLLVGALLRSFTKKTGMLYVGKCPEPARSF
jgi:hypothetical protein